MKRVIITRKIQIVVNEDNKEIRKTHYETLHYWNFTLTRCANLIATHQFVIENIKDLMYLVDEVKVKAADIKKDPEGILNTSRMNTTYRLLSKKHLEDVPSTFLTTLNSWVCKNFSEEKQDYYTGKRSLRNYRKNVPMPFQKKSLNYFQWNEKLNQFTFTLAKIPFKTYLGQDRSGNRQIIDRVLSGEYKLSDSSLKYDDRKNKWYLLLTVSFDSMIYDGSGGDKICNAWLGFEIPIISKAEKRETEIGSKEEFLHRRLQIQAKLRRLQVAIRYNDGGSGRKRKLQAIERFHEKEKHYVKTKMHLYSKKLVDFAIDSKCGKIILNNYKEVAEDTKKEDNQGKLLLRNWSYYGLSDMINYKANKYNIEVEVL